MRLRPTPLAPLIALALLFLTASSASAAGPTISNTTFSGVGTTVATLEGEITPSKRTSYHFEYGLGDCAVLPSDCTRAPIPDPPKIEGASPVPVATVIEGLTPGTAYHFRLLASNNDGEAESPDLTFATYSPPPLFGPCPNDALRTGPGTRLPDCRAYEQASPADKNGSDVGGDTDAVQASPNGDAITFFNFSGLPGGTGAQDFPSFLARRGSADWSTQGLFPPAAYGASAAIAGWTPDLSQVFSNVADTADGDRSFLLRSSADGSITTVTPHAPGGGATLAGASADGSTVYFQSRGQLTPDAAPGRDNLYVWDRGSGAIALAGQIPLGADVQCGIAPPCATPPGGSFAGPYNWYSGTNPATLARGGIAATYYVQPTHAISADGERAYFTAGDSGQIYLREHATGPGATTLHVSASEKRNGGGTDGTDAAGAQPAQFMAASADGSAAFLTSSEKLTDDATTGLEPSPATIGRALVADGSGKTLDFLPATARGVTLGGEYVYWANPVKGAIGRAKLDGSADPEPEFIAGADNPQYVAVGAEYVYWTNAGEEKVGSGTIGRAKLGAGGAEEVQQDFIPASFGGTFNPRGIAVDSTHIYWGNVGDGTNGSRSLMRANLDGSTGIGRFGAFSAYDVAIGGPYIYFTENSPGAYKQGCFRRLPLADPTALETLYCNGLQDGQFQGIAVDGSHLYWTNRDKDTIGRANLDGTGANEEFITDAGRPQGVAVDTEHVYFSANGEALTNAGNDLYRYDAEADPGEHLTDLTVDHSDPDGAEVRGVLGTSSDGSYVYFIANGVLAPGAVHGDCLLAQLSIGAACNLYLAHADDTIFIARLNAADEQNWRPRSDGSLNQGGEGTARVTPDGQTLLFLSTAQLTAYDNRGVPQLYRYRVGDPAPLVCVSCNPTGAPPTGPASLQSIEAPGPIVGPAIPGQSLTRNLSADGDRVFFDTEDKLLAADTNGEAGCPPVSSEIPVGVCQDVYEWEAPGTGSCTEASSAFSAVSGGCLYLLSAGTGSSPSFFADASASGGDAFIFTRDSLVPQDQDQLLDVYDAGVNGGLFSQHPVTPPGCEADACRGPFAPPPPPQGSSSSSFQGPANPAIKRPKPRHRRKPHHRKKHAHRAAGHNRGGRK